MPVSAIISKYGLPGYGEVIIAGLSANTPQKVVINNLIQDYLGFSVTFQDGEGDEVCFVARRLNLVSLGTDACVYMRCDLRRVNRSSLVLMVSRFAQSVKDIDDNTTGDFEVSVNDIPQAQFALSGYSRMSESAMLAMECHVPRQPSHCVQATPAPQVKDKSEPKPKKSLLGKLAGWLNKEKKETDTPPVQEEVDSCSESQRGSVPDFTESLPETGIEDDLTTSPPREEIRFALDSETGDVDLDASDDINDAIAIDIDDEVDYANDDICETDLLIESDDYGFEDESRKFRLCECALSVKASTPQEALRKEDEDIQIERERELDEIQKRILDYVQKYHKDPREMLEVLLRGKIVLQPDCLSRILVNSKTRIILPDYDESEIKLGARERTLYILFLLHPEGMKQNEVCDYRSELSLIYDIVKPGANEETARACIDNLCEPFSDALRQSISKIKKAVVHVIRSEDTAREYYINGEPGGKYSIALSRDKVILPAVFAN